MIGVVFSTASKTLALTQRTASLIFGNIRIFSIFLITGLTIEEAIYGLRLIKYLGLI